MKQDVRTREQQDVVGLLHPSPLQANKNAVGDQEIAIDQRSNCVSNQENKDMSMQKQSKAQDVSADKQLNHSFQKPRIKKFDYLNKYSQHQILDARQASFSKVAYGQGRADHYDNITNRRRLPSANHSLGKIYGSKGAGSSSEKEGSVVRNSADRHAKGATPAYLAYLQEYQKNSFRGFDEDPLYLRTENPIDFNPRPLFAEKVGQDEVEKALFKIPSLAQDLNAEISHQNQILRGQISQYRGLIAKLQTQLNCLRQELLVARQAQAEFSLAMEQQLQVTRVEAAKYKNMYQVLNQQMAKLACSQDDGQGGSCRKAPRNCDKQNRQIQNQGRSKSKSGRKKLQPQKDAELLEIEQKVRSFISRVSSTLNLSHTSQKLESRLLKVNQEMERCTEENKKYRNFIYNLTEMYKKIERFIASSSRGGEHEVGEPSLKYLWKWLKHLGATYSFLQEIKPILAKRANRPEQDNLKVILEHLIIARPQPF